MPRLLILLLCLISLSASAQTLLKRPLQFVTPDSVFVLPRADHNVIMDIMAVAPFASPKTIVATKAERKEAKANGGVLPAPTTAFERTEHNAKMLLLTADARYAEELERNYFTTLPQALVDDGILPLSERQAAAQQLLNLTGTIIATDNARGIYVNVFENCVARVHTKKFRMLLDMISQYPDGPMVKLRIDGLDKNGTPFALHIRIPEHGAPDKYYINGHEIIRPVIANGYLVIDRKWRNGEEVYFVLN